MWRKLDYSKRWMSLYPTPKCWEEKQFVHSSTVDSDGLRKTRSNLVSVSSDEIDSKIMDPKVVNLESLIEAGVTVDPKYVGSILNLSDAADIEEYRRPRESSMYEFLLNNKDQLVKK